MGDYGRPYWRHVLLSGVYRCIFIHTVLYMCARLLGIKPVYVKHNHCEVQSNFFLLSSHFHVFFPDMFFSSSDCFAATRFIRSIKALISEADNQQLCASEQSLDDDMLKICCAPSASEKKFQCVKIGGFKTTLILSVSIDNKMLDKMTSTLCL